MAFGLDDIITRNPETLSTDLAEQTVLMSTENGTYYGLTATGQDIWQQLAQPVSIRQLCQQLAAKYQAPQSTVEADTLAFLAYLEKRGLIVAAPGTPRP